MDLQTLANIGEFLGGFAILISLVYLVVNVRQNTAQLKENLRALQRVEMRSTYEQHDRYRAAMLDPEIADMFVKGISGERLSPSDSVRFNLLSTMITYSTQNNWDAGEQGVMEQDEWERIREGFANRFVNSPGGRRFWESQKSQFKPGFVAEVEADIHSNERVDDSDA